MAEYISYFNRQQIYGSSFSAYLSTAYTVALDSAYVYGTSGDAFGAAFLITYDGTLTDFWFLPGAKTGTGSPDGNLNWEIRSGFGNQNYKPGTTVISSGTISCAALTADTWYKVTGLSVSLSAGTHYMLVIGDADGNGTNYTTINYGSRVTSAVTNVRDVNITTDGWATAGTLSLGAPHFAFKFADGTIFGGAMWRTTGTTTSNTLARGIKLTIDAGYPSIVWHTMNAITGSFGGWTVKVLRGADALPNATPYYSHTIPAGIDYSNTQAPGNYNLPNPPVLSAGETWYLLIIPDASSNLPVFTAGIAGVDSDLRTLNAGITGVSLCHKVHEIAGPSWSTDLDGVPTSVYFGYTAAPKPTVAA